MKKTESLNFLNNHNCKVYKLYEYILEIMVDKKNKIKYNQKAHCMS